MIKLNKKYWPDCHQINPENKLPTMHILEQKITMNIRIYYYNRNRKTLLRITGVPFFWKLEG